MELLETLFKRKHNNENQNLKEENNFQQVRLILFKECHWRGRKLLFDSTTIDQVPAGKDDKPNFKPNSFPCIVEVSNGYAYMYKGPPQDENIISEMIFGAVALNYKGLSLKIHILDEPRRLLCTKVFLIPPSLHNIHTKRKVNGNDVIPNHNLNINQEEGSVSFSLSMGRGDSGYCEDQSFNSISSERFFPEFELWAENLSENSSLFSSQRSCDLSNSSWSRRMLRSDSTRFDMGYESWEQLSDPTISSNLTSVSSRISSSSQTSYKIKLGLAMMIKFTDSDETEMVRKCLEQGDRLEAMVYRVRRAALTAGPCFVHAMYTATLQAIQWLEDLLKGLRLQPVWLSLVTNDGAATNNIVDTLLSDICYLVNIADTKNTNFFFSTVLTYVLTYHLGWVPTVSPYDTLVAPKEAGSSNHYNAQWAQISDLFGCIGLPPRVSRTIVCSTTNKKLIEKLLIVLTYFIRCGDVVRYDVSYQDSTIDNVVVRDVVIKDNLISDCKLQVPLVNNKSMIRNATSRNLSDIFNNLEVESGSKSYVDTEGCCTNTLSVDSSNHLVTEKYDLEPNVVFVLGEDEKLVGLKNKSNNGARVKKSSKVHEDPDIISKLQVVSDKDDGHEKKSENSNSPSKCCLQTLEHSKPMKHSGFKFEFEKYPRIVTNYMKSKNLELQDRHYIGKPGNLKLDNFQFDPTIVPPIQEEQCDACNKCQVEYMLQTPTNASELEYFNDSPDSCDPQYAKESFVGDTDNTNLTEKHFIKKQQENTIVVNVDKTSEVGSADEKFSKDSKGEKQYEGIKITKMVELPLPQISIKRSKAVTGTKVNLFGGLTDHYVPDLVLQGITARPVDWQLELQRDLDLSSYMFRALNAPLQSLAIIADVDTWEVGVAGRGCGAGGMSALVAAMLEPLPAMRRARVPAAHCLSFVECKLRELCVLSKGLAEVLVSSERCDVASLARALNVQVNDVPLLLAVATTHTPQLAARYGITYR